MYRPGFPAWSATRDTPPQITLPYDQTTNRIADTSYSYDANGNLTAMPGYTMSYDIENRMVGLNGLNVQYFYNPSNQRVRMVDASGTWQYYLYGADGRRLGTYGRQWSMTTLISSDVYFGGKKLQSQGQLVYQDRLGSNINIATYYPYGESSGNSFIGGDSFATYTRDSASNFDYAVNRYYSSTINRFLTPDPYNGSAALTKPQSWNRYAYVENDPVNGNDPAGLGCWQVSSGLVGGDVTSAVSCSADFSYFGGTGGSRFDLPAIDMDMPADSGFVTSGGGGAAEKLIHVTNFTKTGSKATEVQNSLRWLQAELPDDSDCDKYLQGNHLVIDQLLGNTGGSMMVGVGNFDDPTVNAVAGPAGTDLPSGVGIVVALGGAYFNSSASTGVEGIAGGTVAAQVLILLHELAHSTGAADFRDDDKNKTDQDHNNGLILSHCQKTIDFFSR